MLACGSPSSGGGGGGKKDLNSYTLAYEDFGDRIPVAQGASVTISVDATATTIPDDANPTYSIDAVEGIAIDAASGAVTVGAAAQAKVHNVAVSASAGNTTYTGTIETTLRIPVTDITAQKIPLPAETHKRYHYVAFTLESPDDTDQGLYQFGLTAAGEPVPGKTDFENGMPIHRKVTATATKNVLAHTLGSGLKAFMADTNNQGKVIVDSDAQDVDQYLLTPGASYTLYAYKPDTEEVQMVANLATDAFTGIVLPGGVLNDAPALISGNAPHPSFPYHASDTLLTFPFGFNLRWDNLEQLIASVDGAQYLVSGGSTNTQGSFGPRTVLVPSLGGSQPADGDSPYIEVDGEQRGVGIFVIPQAALTATHSYTYNAAYAIGTSSSWQVHYSLFPDN